MDGLLIITAAFSNYEEAAGEARVLYNHILCRTHHKDIQMDIYY
jgi:hypothetical protein